MGDKKEPLDYASPRGDEPKSQGCLVVIACLGVVSFLLGCGWLYTFLLTDFRAHHRPVMIPVGIVATLLGIAMMALPMLARRKR